MLHTYNSTYLHNVGHVDDGLIYGIDEVAQHPQLIAPVVFLSYDPKEPYLRNLITLGLAGAGSAPDRGELQLER